MFLQADIQCPARGAHAETAIKSHERERLEKLVRSMARHAISDERVIIEGPQSIRVKLRSRWADGTDSLHFTPSEFLERLVALIPAPKFHTTRYYGILASRHRIAGICQTNRIHSLMSNMGPMVRIQIHQWKVPHAKNKNRANENASPGHRFSNEHSKSTCSSVINAADAWNS